MFPPRLRLPLSSLAAFALGVGLTFAWFQRGDSDPPTKPAVEKGRHSDGETARNGTGIQSPPWKVKSNPSEALGTDEPIAAALPQEDEETIRRGLRAHFRHEARVEAHAIATRLGLDPGQTEDFLAARLQDAESRIQAMNPKPGPAWWSDDRGHAWLKANLNTEQRLAYEAYQRDLHREQADRHALEETNGIARAVALTEEQRAALLRKFAENHIPIEVPDFFEFMSYGEPINVEVTDSSDAPTKVIITESRIEMPVFAERQPWLSDILTEEQLATYRAFQEKQRELETLKEEEMRATEGK